LYMKMLAYENSSCFTCPLTTHDSNTILLPIIFEFGHVSLHIFIVNIQIFVI
jgi:hypothetical protein